MAIIYRLRYWNNGEACEQSFKYEQDARFNYDKLLESDDVNNLELWRQRIMRPSLSTILHILNGQPYVHEQKIITTSGNRRRAATTEQGKESR